ncbi:hypothetical protein D3C85_995060 [compost metagenome]
MIVTGQCQALLQNLVELPFVFTVGVASAELLILPRDAAAQRLDALAAAQWGDAVDTLVVEHQATDPVAGIEHHPGGQGAKFGGKR